MPLTPVKTPRLLKGMFPNYTWDIPNSKKVIYLTFDDGPTPEITEWTLKTLANYNATATFFCIGANVEKYPEVFKKVLHAGHSIGNHTHNHLKGWKTNNKTYLKNIALCDTAFNLEVKHHKHLFRPPYGKITPKQGKSVIQLGYKIIMWDVLSFDWNASVEKEQCLKNVISETESGSIIVFHDSVKASKNMQYTLPKVLKYYSDKGYSFEAIPS